MSEEKIQNATETAANTAEATTAMPEPTVAESTAEPVNPTPVNPAPTPTPTTVSTPAPTPTPTPTIDSTPAPSTQPAPVKKKGGKCGLIILIMVIALPLVLCGGSYLAYKKVTAVLAPQDFGIKYTEADYKESFEAIGFQSEPTLLCIDCPDPVYSEPNEVSVLVPNEQTSAVFEYVNQLTSTVQFSGTQIKVTENRADMVTNVSYDGKSYPITVSGNVEKLTDNSISVQVFDLKIGALKLPENVNAYAQEALQELANSKLAGAGDNVRIDKLDLTENGVLFEGLVPTKAEISAVTDIF